MRLFRLAMTLTLFIGAVANGAEPTTKPVPFDTHDGYFTSNKFEPDAPASLVVLKDQKAFDEVFGVAMVMGDKSHRLPPDAFDEKMIVAVIHRGKAFWEYQVQSVQAEGNTLVVKYTTQSTPNETAEFACPLIISISRGAYTAVQFVEDGKVVKRIEMEEGATKPANAQRTLTEEDVKKCAARFLKEQEMDWGDPVKVEERDGNYWVYYATPEKEVQLLSHRTVIISAQGSARFLPRR